MRIMWFSHSCSSFIRRLEVGEMSQSVCQLIASLGRVTWWRMGQGRPSASTKIRYPIGLDSCLPHHPLQEQNSLKSTLWFASHRHERTALVIDLIALVVHIAVMITNTFCKASGYEARENRIYKRKMRLQKQMVHPSFRNTNVSANTA